MTGAEVTGARRIIQLGRNAWKEAAADDSGLLVDAADYYRDFYYAARDAQRYILMSGWQFDSGVKLLRGQDLPPDGSDVRLLKFLNTLCEQKPGLEIYIIAWDFHLVFAAEREWMQRILFHWMTHKRLRFVFLDCPVTGGSHHQKYTVIDGRVACLGGMDVCEARWDDRCHREDNPWRISRGQPQKPYHDVQVYLAGRAPAAALIELFREQWSRAAGEPLSLPAEVGGIETPSRPRGLLPIGKQVVAFSRTDPRADDQTVREVEHLFVDAIAAADRLIYIETQYFSSRRVCAALATRMTQPERARLEIVILVNERAEALKEEIAVGLRQAKNLAHLREVATETGHKLGLFYTVCDGPHEKFRATYIHSKLLLVDDRFLTVGSANMTNRSMGIDSELHCAWESGQGADAGLRRAIRGTRVSLLAEHAGISGVTAVRRLVRIEGLVERLEELAARGTRLQRHGPPTRTQEAVMAVIDPEDLPFDPDTSEPNDSIVDEPSDDHQHRRRAHLRGLVGSMLARNAERRNE